jgi:hypothetical protein
MLDICMVLVLALYASALPIFLNRKLLERIRVLERDLQGYSEVMSKMAEVQIQTHRKFSACFEDLEERIMELSVPSSNPDLPLERRHQVLALARQGVELEEIVKRLKAPVGEAELILNLQKYRGGVSSRPAKANPQVNPHA